MAATDLSQNNGQNFDANKALKNYAANMAMSSFCWPTGFDSSSSAGLFSAYSQASALAAAATSMQNLNGQSPNNNGSSSSSMVSSTNGVGCSVGIPYSAAAAASFISSTTNMPMNMGTALSFPAHSTTPNSPKKKPQPVPDGMKDDTYWDRRKRNNESARRSRESRRQKEEAIAGRVVYLEHENLQLRTEVQMLRNEIEKLRIILYNTHH